MKKPACRCLLLTVNLFALRGLAAAVPSTDARLPLTQGWMLQSSAKIQEAGPTLSTASFRPRGWHSATVPTTVLAALVKNGVFPDPYFGVNLRSVPGTAYSIGSNFSNLAMPPDSPFAVAWWYRTEFHLPARYRKKTVWLRFDGINYRANIWLNGRQIANADQVAGCWRLYEFDVTEAVLPGKPNVLAVEVFPPRERDLAITFVDWNPAPPDKNMGLWRKVYLTASGPVALRHPQVVTRLALPSTDIAHLTVITELRNASSQPVRGILRGRIGVAGEPGLSRERGTGARIEQLAFSQEVELAARESKEVSFTPERFPQLRLPHPRLWWPAQMGTPSLYRLELKFDSDGRSLDRLETRFGIRVITSELTGKGHRLFRINGKRILIRGGGWAPDMLLRESAERLEAEFRYVRAMNLNTIRQEGKLETDEFFELADRYGILVMAGWCCCDAWERWAAWPRQNYSIAQTSLRDQILRLRGHPSLLVWLNGSDQAPPPEVEFAYLNILDELHWPNPVLSSAEALAATVTGPSGVKQGIYQYVPPVFWLLAAHPEVQQSAKNFRNFRAGAFGFNTETSPGPAIPPLESLRQMLPPEHLWPMDDSWNFHAGGGDFKTLDAFTQALSARYGAARSLEDYVMKAQLMAYEGERAMFEAYARNKYDSTGVIQWMLNNGWPSMIWHLYDYYLRPAGGYFGSKKACEPLHPQYSYDDRSGWLASSQYEDARNLTLTARIYNLDMTEKFSQQARLDAPADSSNKVFTIPEITGLTPAYFLLLTLDDGAGKRLSSNLYWLSTRPDVVDWPNVTHSLAPVLQYGDLTALAGLPPAEVKAAVRTTRNQGEGLVTVAVENPGPNLAFLVHLRLVNRDGKEIVPVLWEDNYFSLLPGEKRTVAARYRLPDAAGATPALHLEGWNVRLTTTNPSS